VGSREQGKCVLQNTMWGKRLEVKWTLLNVYGAAQTEHKEEFLTEIASFCSKISDPYIICGDFNIIRFSSGEE
jgi:exonuclease III